jgi:hypothetical protein
MRIRLVVGHEADPDETIKHLPTWADFDNLPIMRGKSYENRWGARVPLKHFPMPKKGDVVKLHHLSGDTSWVTVLEVLAFNAQYAYCSVYG